MANQFGSKIKELREASGLLQRQVASQLEIDTPMLSKIERGERKAKREQVGQFAKLYRTGNDELLILWLVDQLFNVIEGEYLALKAIQMTEKKIKIQSKSQKKK